MDLQSSRGFTLVELAVTIAVLAILTSIALPSFKSTLRSNRMATANNELLAAIGLARSEAIRNGFGAGVCAANADATACDATVSNWAPQGWLVWADANPTRGFQAADRVLRVSQALPAVTMNYGAGTAVQFDRRGRLVPPVAGAGAPAFAVRPSDCGSGESMQRDITINVSGQVSSVRGTCPGTTP